MDLDLSYFGIKSTETPYKSSKRQKINRALKMFHRAWEKSETWRKNKKLADNFYDGDQLSEEERQVLGQRSQPDVVINKLKPQIDLIIGLQERFRQRIKVFQRNESENDLMTAEAISEALRFVDQINDIEFKDAEVFEDGVVGGRGWFHPIVEMDEEFEPEVKILSVPSEDIVVDPDARNYDLQDGKNLWHTLWYDEEDLIALFPKKERLIRKAAQSFLRKDMPSSINTRKYAGDDYLARLYAEDDVRNLYYDKACGRIRVLNHWYKTRESRTIVIHPDLGMGMIGTGVSRKDIDAGLKQMSEQTGVEPEVFDRNMEVVKVCSLIGGEELEEKDSPFAHNLFPFVPYTVFMNRQTREPYGVIKNAIDSQKEVNKRRSKALHILNTQRIIAEDGSVEDEERARAEVARPDGYVKINRGFKFEVQRDTEIGRAQLDLYQSSIREIEETMGINRDLAGQVTNARSGTALDRRIEQGLAVLSKVFSNWKRTKMLVARQVVSLIQQYWTEEKAIRVTDDQSVVKFLHLNQKVNIKGSEIVVRNVQSGKYDLIFDQSESSMNMGEDVFRELAKLAQTGQIPPDIVMEFAPVPYAVKQRILAILRPQQPQGGPEAGGEQGLPPEAAMNEGPALAPPAMPGEIPPELQA